jgi:hypothetical protein
VATVNFRDAMLWVNGVDLSNDVESVTLNRGSEMLDETAMGDDTRINKGGLFTWSLDVNFHQDFVAAQVDATVSPLLGTTTCFELRPHNSCTTTINPSYTGIGVVESYNPLGGSVGSLLDAPMTIQSAGTLARSIAAT